MPNFSFSSCNLITQGRFCHGGVYQMHNLIAGKNHLINDFYLLNKRRSWRVASLETPGINSFINCSLNKLKRLIKERCAEYPIPSDGHEDRATQG